MDDPEALASGRDANGREPAVDELARTLGIGPPTAERLVHAGHTTPEAVRALSDAAIEELGVPPDELQRIRAPPSPTPAAGPDGNRAVERWIDSVRRPDRVRKKHVMAAPKDSAAILKKWVQGDDGAMEEWIQESEAARAPAPPPTPVAGAPVASGTPFQATDREETVVRWLTGLLDRVKSDQFDPSSMIQEFQDLQRQLYDERNKRKQLEDEVEHVKRGSIAVIKYVRSREAREREMAVQSKDAEIAELKLRLLSLGATEEGLAATASATSGAGAPSPLTADAVERAAREVDRKLREEFAAREHEYVDRETELRRRLVQLEAEVRSLRSEEVRMKGQEALLNQRGAALPEELAQRFKEADTRERDLVARENELRSKFEEIRIASDEIERHKLPIAMKEKELANWEQGLHVQRQALELEARRVEQLRQSVEGGGTMVSQAEMRKWDDARNAVTQKEQELAARERAMNERIVELEKMTLRAAETEAEKMASDARIAVQEAVVKSGVRRLDDLLYGGFPIGAQILVNGPAHAGKNVLARLFIAEGLRSGIPAILVVTDQSYTQVREEMTSLLPNYPELEKKGMLRYVDLYSRSLGVQQSEPSARLLSSNDKGVLEQLTQAVNNFSLELKEKFPTYRLLFESVSTVTAYLDTASTFKFLQPFAGRRKLDGASSYYILETGMHTESDLQTLEHMMDGSINLKIEQLKTFLSVKGIGDAQSRAWVGFTFSKKSFSLGSFSLDHIR